MARHVLVSGDRLVTFDLEHAYRPEFPLPVAVAFELSSTLRSLERLGRALRRGVRRGLCGAEDPGGELPAVPLVVAALAALPPLRGAPARRRIEDGGDGAARRPALGVESRFDRVIRPILADRNHAMRLTADGSPRWWLWRSRPLRSRQTPALARRRARVRGRRARAARRRRRAVRARLGAVRPPQRARFRAAPGPRSARRFGGLARDPRVARDVRSGRDRHARWPVGGVGIGAPRAPRAALARPAADRARGRGQLLGGRALAGRATRASRRSSRAAPTSPSSSTASRGRGCSPTTSRTRSARDSTASGSAAATRSSPGASSAIRCAGPTRASTSGRTICRCSPASS